MASLSLEKIKCIPNIQTQNGSYIEVATEEHNSNIYLICLTTMNHEGNSGKTDKPSIDVESF
jgi:hypothetical protein